ncbi:GNAT family N-acetyltransferase [Spongorhabdus nitratireducens]
MKNIRSVNKIHIAPLTEYSSFLETLTSWSYQEWGQRDPSNSLEAARHQLQQCLKSDSVPVCYVAVCGEQPAGFITVKIRDMPDRFPDAEHWIGSLLIAPKYRRQGVGSLLMAHLIKQLPALGVGDLYLWTATAELFYAGYDFIALDRFRHLQQDVVVMVRKSR